MATLPTAEDTAKYKDAITEHIRRKGFESSFDANAITELSIQATKLIEGTKYTLTGEAPPLMALLTLYDLAILIDDSGSMRFEESGTRITILDQILKIISHVYQFATAAGEIKTIRFLNSLETRDNVKNSEIDSILKDHGYLGLTKIGKELEKKILKPLVEPSMTRPLLVMVITDGNVEGEAENHLQDVIQKYVDMLKSTKDNYVVFQFSRIGDDQGAQDLLEKLDNIAGLSQYIDCQPADVAFKLVNDALRSDQLDLVLNLMIGAIDSSVDE